MDWKIKAVMCITCKGKCQCKPIPPDDVYDILEMVGRDMGFGNYSIYIRPQYEHEYED